MGIYEGVEVGGIYDTLNGGKLEVLAIHDYRNVEFKFLDTGYKGSTQVGCIRTGSVKNWGYSLRERVGEVFSSTISGNFTLTEYIGAQKVRVTFNETGTEVWTHAQRVVKGLVWDPMAKNIAFGQGYIGVGPYSSKDNEKAYDKWIHMLLRCVSEDPRDVAYFDKQVVPEWSCFQTFAEWAEKQTGFDIPDCQLDKDILVQGNKVYGPETCCFVPPRVNNLTTGGFKGGTLDKHGKWTFTVRKIDQYEQKRFYSQEEGLKWYKEVKEAYVKEVADEYKNVLDQRVYDALYLWKVK